MLLCNNNVIIMKNQVKNNNMYINSSQGHIRKRSETAIFFKKINI